MDLIFFIFLHNNFVWPILTSAWRAARVVYEDFWGHITDLNMVSVNTGLSLSFSLHSLPPPLPHVNPLFLRVCTLFCQLNFIKHFLGGGFVKHMQVCFLYLEEHLVNCFVNWVLKNIIFPSFRKMNYFMIFLGSCRRRKM